MLCRGIRMSKAVRRDLNEIIKKLDLDDELIFLIHDRKPEPCGFIRIRLTGFATENILPTIT
jgi:hypothetical protein